MRIQSIRLTNFQAFADSTEIALGGLTIFVGRNNAGKSSILNAVRQVQSGLALPAGDLVRVGADAAQVVMKAEAIPSRWKPNQSVGDAELFLQIPRAGAITLVVGIPGHAQSRGQNELLPGQLPDAVVLPLLVERSSRRFDEQVKLDVSRQIRSEVENVAALISPLVNGASRKGQVFLDACMSIFGFRIGLVPSLNGQTPGVITENDDTIPVSAMGTGVISITRMLAHLLTAKDKVILIEEPENDLHPEALRRVLELIASAAERNQVILTTHSHIVLNTLGAIPGSLVYGVRMSLEDGIPTSTTHLADSPEERFALLAELGHQLSDFGIHEGFLILEEASAESVIQRLVSWFEPQLLGRLRTVAAYGAGDVVPRFSDLRRMFVFVHLQDVYRNRAWVLVDGDDAGRKAVGLLRTTFPDWPADHFQFFSEPAFERYYPEEFRAQADMALSEPDRRVRQQLKHELLVDVLRWADEDHDRAREAFRHSAAEVLEVLRAISENLQNH